MASAHPDRLAPQLRASPLVLLQLRVHWSVMTLVFDFRNADATLKYAVSKGHFPAVLAAVGLITTAGSSSASAALAYEYMRIECAFEQASDLESMIFEFPAQGPDRRGTFTAQVTTRWKDGRDEVRIERASTRPIHPFTVSRDRPPSLAPAILLGEGSREMLIPGADMGRYTYRRIDSATWSGRAENGVSTGGYVFLDTEGNCLLILPQ